MIRPKKQRSHKGLSSIAQKFSRMDLERPFQLMTCIRAFEERVKQLFIAGEIKGTVHSSVGQEAIAVGACAALKSGDFIVTHHRGHGHCIAKGARTDRLMAELMGRQDGYCHGLGGSMHVAALDLNILGSNGIIGAGIGIGVGAALSAQLRQSNQICLVSFGDGASSEGIVHEAMNLAAIWKLPIVFLCENNLYGLSTPMEQAVAGKSIALRAHGYKIPGISIDGNDVLQVFRHVTRAVKRARGGQGPTLIEALTYRWDDHSMRANLPRYRSVAEEAAWRKKDPIARLAALLIQEKMVKPERLEEIRNEVDKQIDASVRFAKESAQPGLEILTHAVYSPQISVTEHLEPRESQRKITYTEAINEALMQSLENDPRVIVIGEDIGRIGGIFGVTRGLLEKYGSKRVLETPISESAIAAAAVGAAMTGMRPVVEIQIFDLVTLMMDMIVNQAAKLRFMSGGEARIPIVFRGPQGGGVRLAAQHSQSLEAWFAHVPGLFVIAPSTPYDAKGLLLSAIREDNPVVFLEHKMLYLGQAAPVPKDPYLIPLGKATIRNEGTDVTVVATMAMVEKALAAARQLKEKGVSVEVIDPRTIHPLDEETIINSVKKTNRLVIAHEAWKRGGVGAEIATIVMEKAFDYLDAPVARVGAPDVPMPFNYLLEQRVIPSQEDIVQTILQVCYRI